MCELFSLSRIELLNWIGFSIVCIHDSPNADEVYLSVEKNIKLPLVTPPLPLKALYSIETWSILPSMAVAEAQGVILYFFYGFILDFLIILKYIESIIYFHALSVKSFFPTHSYCMRPLHCTRWHFLVCQNNWNLWVPTKVDRVSGQYIWILKQGLLTLLVHFPLWKIQSFYYPAKLFLYILNVL